MEPEHCHCARLADVLPGRNIQGEPFIAGFAGDEVVSESAAYYRCLDCGQWWRDGYLDDHALRKVDGPEG